MLRHAGAMSRSICCLAAVEGRSNKRRKPSGPAFPRAKAPVIDHAMAQKRRKLFTAFVHEHNTAVNQLGDEAFYHQPQHATSGQAPDPPETPSRANGKQQVSAVAPSPTLRSIPQPTQTQTWRERRDVIIAKRQTVVSRNVRPELNKAIQQMLHCLKQSPDVGSFDFELRYQAMLLKLQAVLAPLNHKHFAAATIQQLLILLRSVSACGSFRLGFVTSSSLRELSKRSAHMSGSELIGALNAVLTLEEDQGVPFTQRTVFAESLGEQLLAPAHEAEWLRGIHPHSIAKLIYALLPGRRNIRRDPSLPPAQAILSDAFGFRVLSKVLKHSVVVDDQAADSAPRLHAALQLSHVVCLVCAVAHYRVPTEMAMQLLTVAAPLVRDGVHDLKAHQLSFVLMAYARVGYKDPAWFTAVGQRAGDLGEKMWEDDAARILQAFDMVGIEHTTLRRSLESSLRMRSLRRAALFNKVF